MENNIVKFSMEVGRIEGWNDVLKEYCAKEDNKGLEIKYLFGHLNSAFYDAICPTAQIAFYLGMFIIQMKQSLAENPNWDFVAWRGDQVIGVNKQELIEKSRKEREEQNANKA